VPIEAGSKAVVAAGSATVVTGAVMATGVVVATTALVVEGVVSAIWLVGLQVPRSSTMATKRIPIRAASQPRMLFRLRQGTGWVSAVPVLGHGVLHWRDEEDVGSSRGGHSRGGHSFVWQGNDCGAGYDDVASTSGYDDVASTSGYDDVASTSGYDAVASTSGYDDVADATTDHR